MLIQGLKKEKKTFSKRIHKKLPQYEAVLTNLFPSKETIEFLLPSSGRWTSHSRSGKISLWMGWWWRRERLVTPHSNRRRRGIFLHVRNECQAECMFFLLSRFLPYNFYLQMWQRFWHKYLSEGSLCDRARRSQNFCSKTIINSKNTYTFLVNMFCFPKSRLVIILHRPFFFLFSLIHMQMQA